MENIKYAPEEPICAIATALAPSALGIIRCSGKNSISLVSKIFSRPKALLSAVPIAEVGRKREISVLEGDVPSPINPPKGCYFNTRCPYADERCRSEKPELRDIGCGHLCACHKV